MLMRRLTALALVVAVILAVGCGGGSNSTSSSGNGDQQAEAAAAATGDIPDNQVFLTYRGPGYTVKYRRDGRRGAPARTSTSRTRTTRSISC
jgi:hypothetical protein